jgi:hypothetical protein
VPPRRSTLALGKHRLDRLERWLIFVFDISLFILVRLVLVDITLAEFRQRSHGVLNPPLPAGRISPSQAQFVFEQERLADEHTDDKVKQLLTLTSSLTALLTAIAVSRFGLGVSEIAVVLLPLLAAVYICLGGVLDIRIHSLPTITQVGADPEDQEWARGMVSATGVNRGSRFFRVDLYRAALRWFLVALLIAPFVVALRSGIAARAIEGCVHSPPPARPWQVWGYPGQDLSATRRASSKSPPAPPW